MSYKIEFLPIACEDLEEIDNHLSRFYDSTPDKFFHSFHRKLALLKDNPRMYSEWEDDRSMRRFVIGNYLAFYRVSDEMQTVTILRVIEGRGNIEALVVPDISS